MSNIPNNYTHSVLCVNLSELHTREEWSIRQLIPKGYGHWKPPGFEESLQCGMRFICGCKMQYNGYK